MDDHESRIARLEAENLELGSRVVKLEAANNAMNRKVIEFMDHYGRDFDNRVAEAMDNNRRRGLRG